MVPGRRFSTRMSARPIRRRKISLPREALRSSASDRLLRFSRTKLEDSPSRNGAVARTPSPPSGFSTLTTSAPRSASCSVQNGAAMKLPTSTTRMPSSAERCMALLYHLRGAPSRPRGPGRSEEPRPDASPQEERLADHRDSALQADEVFPVEQVLRSHEHVPSAGQGADELQVEDGEAREHQVVGVVLELFGSPAHLHMHFDDARIGE